MSRSKRTEMFWNRKNRPVRRESRWQRPDAEASLLRVFRNQYGLACVLIFGALFACTSVVILWGGQTIQWQLQERVDSDVRARVDFEVPDEKRTADRKREAILQTPNVYVRNDAILTSIRAKLMELYTLAKSSETAEAFVQAAQAKGWSVDAEDYNGLKSLTTDAQGAGAQYFDLTVTRLIDFLSDQTFVEKVDDRRKDPPLNALLTWEGGKRLVPMGQLQFVSDTERVQTVADEAVKRLANPVESLRPEVKREIIKALQPDPEHKQFVPLYRFDQPATAKRLADNEAAVPPQFNAYKAGDVLVKAGTVIKYEELALLQHEHAAFREKLATDRSLRWDWMLTRIGATALVFLVLSGLGLYTLHYQPRIAQKPGRAAAMAALLLAVVVVARFAALMQWPIDLEKEFAVAPVVIAAVVLTIVYEQRYAMGVTGGVAILATVASEGGLGLFVTLLTPMATTVFLLRDIRTRSKLIATGLMAGLVAFGASMADSLMTGQGLGRYTLWHASFGGSVAVLAGFIALGMLPAIERLFGVATSLTLLEWADANRPLLRRLAQEAPGTYTHSLMIGTVAQAAADAIGANGLLTRVGAMYHDIGKIAKPEYYVENQEAKINRHDRLGPTLSLLVIVAHVKDGLEMAREYGLPKVLHQFIAEHHGTTVVRYFHRVAAEQAQKAKQKEPSESEFRYPGPKPRTRETAVLMICDSIEGAVRALPEPTPGRIEATVHQVLMDRLNDGQFDDCDITMKELSRVEEAVVKAMCAAYHGRIAYPKNGAKAADADFGELGRAAGANGAADRGGDAEKPQDESDSSSASELATAEAPRR